MTAFVVSVPNIFLLLWVVSRASFLVKTTSYHTDDWVMRSRRLSKRFLATRKSGANLGFWGRSNLRTSTLFWRTVIVKGGRTALFSATSGKVKKRTLFAWFSEKKPGHLYGVIFDSSTTLADVFYRFWFFCENELATLIFDARFAYWLLRVFPVWIRFEPCPTLIAQCDLSIR